MHLHTDATYYIYTYMKKRGQWDKGQKIRMIKPKMLKTAWDKPRKCRDKPPKCRDNRHIFGTMQDILHSGTWKPPRSQRRRRGRARNTPSVSHALASSRSRGADDPSGTAVPIPLLSLTRHFPHNWGNLLLTQGSQGSGPQHSAMLYAALYTKKRQAVMTCRKWCG